jgi:hypothetical protein
LEYQVTPTKGTETSVETTLRQGMLTAEVTSSRAGKPKKAGRQQQQGSHIRKDAINSRDHLKRLKDRKQ